MLTFQYLTLFKYSLFAAHNSPSPLDGERETNTTAPDPFCSPASSLSKVAKVSKGIVFGLLDHNRVHPHPHSHSTRHPHGHTSLWHPHVHAHSHHALVGGHPHASSRVHHRIYGWSHCCRSKAHICKSLGEHVGRCLVTWKQQNKPNYLRCQML